MTNYKITRLTNKAINNLDTCLNIDYLIAVAQYSTMQANYYHNNYSYKLDNSIILRYEDAWQGATDRLIDLMLIQNLEPNNFQSIAKHNAIFNYAYYTDLNYWGDKLAIYHTKWIDLLS